MTDIKAVVGAEEFERKVEAFDEMNRQAIALFMHHADDLEKMLTLSQQGLVKDLKALPSLLYFRK